MPAAHAAGRKRAAWPHHHGRLRGSGGLLALLADVTEGQLAKVRAMAAHIMPRDGQMPDPLTPGASAQMRALLDRAAIWDSGGAAQRE